jgi:hypothetical protein
MTQNPNLAALSAAGVSVWLDDLSRDRLTSGNLDELINTKSVVGVTTNPSIFQAALAQGHAYDAQVAELAKRGTDVEATIRAVTTDDVRAACDLLTPQWKASDGVDGRVSTDARSSLCRSSVRVGRVNETRTCSSRHRPADFGPTSRISALCIARIASASMLSARLIAATIAAVLAMMTLALAVVLAPGSSASAMARADAIRFSMFELAADSVRNRTDENGAIGPPPPDQGWQPACGRICELRWSPTSTAPYRSPERSRRTWS